MPGDSVRCLEPEQHNPAQRVLSGEDVGDRLPERAQGPRGSTLSNDALCAFRNVANLTRRGAVRLH
jgi:hypothetical protein